MVKFKNMGKINKSSNRLQKLQEDIKQFTKERDWEQFHDPKNLALSLVLESAEVLELFQWTKDNEINPKKKDEIGDELADVFYWVLKLADHYGIDILDALEQKMEHNRKKYPTEKARGKADKYNEL